MSTLSLSHTRPQEAIRPVTKPASWASTGGARQQGWACRLGSLALLRREWGRAGERREQVEKGWGASLGPLLTVS